MGGPHVRARRRDRRADRHAPTSCAPTWCSTSGKIYGPAITTYLRQGIQIGTPSVRGGLTGDVYLTIAGNRPPDVGASEVQLEVFLKPLIVWLWIGGLMMAIGTLLRRVPRQPAPATRSIRSRRPCQRLRTNQIVPKQGQIVPKQGGRPLADLHQKTA